MGNHEQQLLDRLTRRSPEDNFVERKSSSVKAQELRQTLVAFSNSLPDPDTAVLFIGVDDKTGAILGVDDAEKVQMRVGDAGEDCYPAIRPTMSVLELDGKRVVAVEVAPSKEKPHFAGPAYIRSGSRSLKASDSLYRDLLTSHCGKAGELLRCKNKFVTIRTVNKRLGNHYPDFAPGVRREGMAEVVSVDPFSVTFHFTQYSDERCTEPLNRIELDWDATNKRRMVIVRGDPA
jgi:Putative DNA-binding domain